MAKKEIEIKTVSYVHVGDKLVNTEDLNKEQKRKLATWLKCRYLSALFQGKAIFYCRDGKNCDPNCPLDCAWKIHKLFDGTSGVKNQAGE